MSLRLEGCSCLRASGGSCLGRERARTALLCRCSGIASRRPGWEGELGEGGYSALERIYISSDPPPLRTTFHRHFVRAGPPSRLLCVRASLGARRAVGGGGGSQQLPAACMPHCLHILPLCAIYAKVCACTAVAIVFRHLRRPTRNVPPSRGEKTPQRWPFSVLPSSSLPTVLSLLWCVPPASREDAGLLPVPPRHRRPEESVRTVRGVIRWLCTRRVMVRDRPTTVCASEPLADRG